MIPTPDEEDLAVFDNIIFLLDESGVEYEVLEHEFVHRSADAAKVRGTKLEEAAKALILVVRTRTSSLRASVADSESRGAGGVGPFGASAVELLSTATREQDDVRGRKKFFMCVVSGDKRMDLKKIKALLDEKNVSLAHPDDVFAVTGLKIGTIPPFPCLFKLDGYCEAGVMEKSHVVFSAGSHYKSIRMKSEDWKELAGVVVEKFARDEE